MPEFISVENVRISLLPATLVRRFAAILIDIVSVFTVVWIGAAAFALSYYDGWERILLPVAVMVLLLLPAIEEVFFDGRTLGKLCLGLRVVQIDGSAPTVWALLLRYFLLWVDVFGSFGTGLLLMFGTKLHRRWGDMAAGTFVAQRDRQNSARSPLSSFADRPNYTRTFAHIDRIDARRAALISRALGAACMHTGTFAAYDFAQRVEAVVGGRLPEEDELHYLSAVLYAYRHAA